MTSANLAELEKRVVELEDEKAVRACINEYMHLCDYLDEGFDLDLLMALFAEDATWEGRGKRYTKTFPRREGKADIRAMFSKYTVPPAHFELNVHFLTSEVIAVNGREAHGTWAMIQTSTFSSGRSQLSSARLNVDFRKEGDGRWRICHFQTESRFNRPVETPWDLPAELPTPDKK